MWIRGIVVTLGLAVAGAVFGAIAGAGAQTVWMVLDGAPVRAISKLVWFGAQMGLIAGAILAPISGWLLMRHVPLWLAFGGTLLGTIAGAGVGAVIGGMWTAMLGGFAGYATSAIALRVRTSRGGRALPASGPGRVAIGG